MKSAMISECGKYRYTLTRVWDETHPKLPFCMLNPSTADAEQDDPTIRRCIAFAKRDGYGGVHIVNLFAYRATDPRELRTAADATGPDNATWLLDATAYAITHNVPFVCAWGSGILWLSTNNMRRILRRSGARLVCLGTTNDGFPRHPLYVRADTPLEPWP